MTSVTFDELLSRVQRPGRYVNGEWNAVHKDRGAVSLAVALCVPESYEAGMCSLELQALYRVVNSRERWLAERAFAPWPDMAAALRESQLSLTTLEGRQAVAACDAVVFVVRDALHFPAVLEMLDLGGLPVEAARRDAGAPPVILVGREIANWEPLANFADVCVAGDAEVAVPRLLDLLEQRKGRREEFLARAAKVAGVYVPSLYASRGGGRPRSRCKQAPDVVTRQAVPLGAVVTNPVVPTIEVGEDYGVVELGRGCPGDCPACVAGTPCPTLRVRVTAEVVEAIEGMIAACGYREIALAMPPGGGHAAALDVARAMRGRHAPEDLVLYPPPLDLDRLLRGEHVSAGAEVAATAEAVLRMGAPSLRFTVTLGAPGQDGATPDRVADLVYEAQQAGQRVLGRRPKLRVDIRYFVPRPGSAFEDAPQPAVTALAALGEQLQKRLRKMGVYVAGPAPEASMVRAVLGRGGRDMSAAVLAAWQAGAAVEGWGHAFDVTRWQAVLEHAGADVPGPASAAGAEAPWAVFGDAPSDVPAAYPARCKEEPCPVCQTLGDGAAAR
ncbi:MAG: hypothetical protein EXR49_03680 [Dehalococcoidia bacterium]|nr:hypothetical protein [Dehalococcoidia bacterium]